MPQVNIPDSLFSEIEKFIGLPASPEEFVVAAVQEKLSWGSRKEEFFQLSDETRTAMLARGFSEADIMSDFARFRQSLNEPSRG